MTTPIAHSTSIHVKPADHIPPEHPDSVESLHAAHVAKMKAVGHVVKHDHIQHHHDE